MGGFLADYISVLTDELGRQPTVEEYSQIMTGYTPEQMPVLSAIARGFATFDHWFCDVPTCTYPNRSFFHAGASSGYVVNTSPPGSFPRTNDAETLFERLDAAGLTWKVYCDPPSHYSLTGVIHAPRLASRFATNFFSTRQFFQDAEKGELPTYSFIEPQIIGWNHNDMHPPFGAVLATVGRQRGADDAASLHFDPPSSLIGGEDLLARVYDAIRSSSSATGSNHLNTTLLVTFDEHGGTYDHVPPPPAAPPDGTGAPGQMGFTFNRSGVRIPTLAISAWIPERTVVSDEFGATSLLATMRERFNLGRPLTARDASARSFADIFTLTSPQAAGGLAAGHPTARPRDARIRRAPRRTARPARQVAPARGPRVRQGPRQDRPRHQAPRHDPETTPWPATGDGAARCSAARPWRGRTSAEVAPEPDHLCVGHAGRPDALGDGISRRAAGMSPRPMKNSPAALSSPIVTTRPRRAICSRSAASPRWLGPGATLVRATGTHTSVVTRPTSTRTSTACSCDLSVSPGDLLGGCCDQDQRREVGRHGKHAERKRRPSPARTTRTPVVIVLATRRPAPAAPQHENEGSRKDQDQADDEVERRVEVRLGRE